MGNCEHTNIIIVTETPNDGKFQQVSKKYVECEDCHEILPIQRITKINRKVTLCTN